MSWVDLAIAIILAAFALNGLTKGLLRQVANLAGFLAGLVLASVLMPIVVDSMPGATVSGIALAPLAFVVIFLTVWIVVNLAAFRAQKRSRGPEGSWLDDLGGTILGLLSGGLLLSVLIVAAVAWNLPVASSLERSRVAGWLLTAATHSVRFVSRWVPVPWLP